MTIKIYGHPFSSFTWKPLIAAYERNVTFEFCMVDPNHTDNLARMAELSPTGQFPALVDGERCITQSNSVIEYLDRFGDAAPMLPVGRDLALNARMLADAFDAYISIPVQQIVGEVLRSKEQPDQRRIDEVKAKLDKAYAWFSKHIAGEWACGSGFTIADCAAAPALFYADWVHPISSGSLKDYRGRLLKHPSVARVVDEARPYRSFFPLGAPNRD